jgi:hypothetical protein
VADVMNSIVTGDDQNVIVGETIREARQGDQSGQESYPVV